MPLMVGPATLQKILKYDSAQNAPDMRVADRYKARDLHTPIIPIPVEPPITGN